MATNSTNTNKRIFVIAGGAWQVPLVKKVKKLGYEAVNSNLYENSPAFEYADYCEVANVLDKEKNLEIAMKYNVDAVLTDESDIAVPTVAYVAKTLGLSTIGEDKAALFTNKYQMRCFCRDHGLNTPEFCECETPEEVIAFMSDIKQKNNASVIMKPLDSQSSRGVYIIENEETVREHFEETKQYSSGKKAVIVERYIHGTEFTVDGIIIGGKHYSLAVSEKKHYNYNPNVASELFFSYDNGKYDYGKLRAQNDKLVDLAELPFGITHAEYKYEDGEFYLIEIAARGGGTRISSDIVPLMTGIDNYQILIEAALGNDMQPDIKEKIKTMDKYRCAVLKFLDTEQDGETVLKINGRDEIMADPKVLELHLEFKEGERIYKAKDDRSRIGFYIAYGDTREELRQRMEWVERTLQVEYK